MDVLIFIFIVFYLILARIRLDWAVMLILAALPFYLIRFKILGVPFTLLEAMILASFFIWFIFQTEFKNFIRGKYGWHEFRENRKKRLAYPFGLEIVLLLIISFIAAGVSGFSDSALGIWKAYFFEPVLLFILILNVFKPRITDKSYQTSPNPSLLRGGIEKILWPLAVSALAVSVLAIYQGLSGDLIFNDFWAAAGQRRAVSFFGYPNAVGLYLGPLVLLFCGWMIHNFKKTQIADMRFGAERLLIILTIVASVLAVYFAKSKGALAGIAAGLAIFIFLAGGKRMKWGIIIFALAVAMGILAYLPLRNFALEKTIYSKSLQIRQQQWKETWEMLKDSRLISGSGLANYQKSIAPYHQEGIFLRDYNDPDWHRKTVFNAEYRAKVWQPTEIYLYPHNIFLNFWSELGLAGVLLFSWIIGKYLAVSFKLLAVRGNKDKFVILGLLCAMVVIIAHGLVDVPYFKNDLAVMFWVMVAIVSLADTNIRMDAHDTNKYKHENTKTHD
ncbi:MAG: O-antigen ligase family protein [Patescibacteria group bacterium]|nr:O-antigen ligase family protein [Patescibacteria group bacterium]